MSEYAGMSFEQLHDVVMSTDPAAVRQAADHWGTVSGSLATLHNQLTANRLSLLEGDGWTGQAAHAFYDHMEGVLTQVSQAQQGAAKAHTALGALADHIGAARTAMGNIPPPAPASPLERQSVLYSEYGVTPRQIDADNARQKALAIVTELASGYSDTALVLDAAHTTLPRQGPGPNALTGPAGAATASRSAPAGGEGGRLGNTPLGPGRGGGAGAPVPRGPVGRRPGEPLVEPRLGPDGTPAGPLARRDGRAGAADDGVDPLLPRRDPVTSLADEPPRAGLPTAEPGQVSPPAGVEGRADGIAGGIAAPAGGRLSTAPAVSGGEARDAESRKEAGGQRPATSIPRQSAHPHGISGGIAVGQPTQPPGPAAPGTPPIGPPPGAAPTPGPGLPGPGGPGGAAPTTPGPHMPATAPAPAPTVGAPAAGAQPALTGPQAMAAESASPLFGPGAVGGAQPPPPPMAAPMSPAGASASQPARRSWFRVRSAAGARRRTSARGHSFAAPAEAVGNPPVIE